MDKVTFEEYLQLYDERYGDYGSSVSSSWVSAKETYSFDEEECDLMENHPIKETVKIVDPFSFVK